MTWLRRLTLTRLWLHLHATPVALGIGALVAAGLCLLVYLPAGKMTSYAGTIDGLEVLDDELGRTPRFLVKLDQGKLVRVSGRRDDGCRKGDRITVVHLGGIRGYISGANGCRRPAHPAPQAPQQKAAG